MFTEQKRGEIKRILGLILVALILFLPLIFSSDNSINNNVVFEVNKIVSLESTLVVDGVSSQIPQNFFINDTDLYYSYYNITSLSLNLSSGNHTVKIIDNSIVVFEENVTISDLIVPVVPSNESDINETLLNETIINQTLTNETGLNNVTNSSGFGIQENFGISATSNVLFYLHNESNTQYPGYLMMLTNNTDKSSIASTSITLSGTAVTCWSQKWITAPNFTNAMEIDGQWNFSVWGTKVSGGGGTASLFAKILKVNTTGEYNFANSSLSGDVIVNSGTFATNWSYTLAASSFTNLSVGERAGIQICVSTSSATANKAYNIAWENTTPSSVTILTSDILGSPPVTTLIYPSNNLLTNINNFNFSCNATVTSPSSLVNITFYWNYSGSFIANGTNSSISGLFNATNFTRNSLADGNYLWNCLACDNSNQCSFASSNYTLRIDRTSPQISTTYPLNTTYTINVSSLNYTVTDANLQVCWYTLNLGASNTTVTCGTNITGLTSTEGSNTWRVYANDSAGNINFSSVTFFKDSINPLVFNLKPVNNSVFNTTNVIEISANITDNIGVSFVLANITLPNGTVNQITLSNSTGQVDKYNNSFTIPNLIGLYNITFIANDTSGNINSSSVTNFTVNDVTNPIVINLTLVANYSVTKVIEIAANVTDNIGVSLAQSKK